jgi:hypothetical protein
VYFGYFKGFKSFFCLSFLCFGGNFVHFGVSNVFLRFWGYMVVLWVFW